jgi:glycosyltransferase involved in cell wall biosynthesis
VLDPGVERLIAETNGAELVKGASADRLRRLYAGSSLFVMPSLVEGFGLVYLEALAHGCPVLGTTNTCLPDIGSEADGIFLTPAGDPDAITAALERLARRLVGDERIRRAARSTALRYPWAAFRQSLREALRQGA